MKLFSPKDAKACFFLSKKVIYLVHDTKKIENAFSDRILALSSSLLQKNVKNLKTTVLKSELALRAYFGRVCSVVSTLFFYLNLSVQK